MTLEQQCRAYCKSQKINPDWDAPNTWQKAPGLRTNGRVKMWHVMIGIVNRKPITSTGNKEAEASKANLQHMINESDKKKPGKIFSCYDE